MLRRLLPTKHDSAAPDWDAIYADFLPRVYRFFCYRVGDGPSAEDLTSATFEKAWRARDGYRNDLAAFSTWLFSIARNVVIDYFRVHKDTLPLDEALVAGEHAMEADVEQRDDFTRLLQLMSELPPRERDLLALKFGAEQSHRQIARILGLSEPNVAVIAHRAVKRLRDQWPHQPEQEHGNPERIE